MGYVFLAIAIGLNAAANLLLKVGAGRLGDPFAPAFFSRLTGNGPLIAGLLLFTINVAFYVAATTRLNLSVAYPVMSAGSLLLVVSTSIVLLRESVGIQHWLGLALIVAGITLTVARGGS
jgi:multidrug transporter EmrE-like cation transporter